MDLLGDSVCSIRRVVNNPDHVDAHVLTKYMNKIKSLKVELEGLKKEILSLNNYGRHVRRASDIEQNLFDFRVAISHLMEQTKIKHAPYTFGLPIMG